MADVHSPETRSFNMSRIKGRDTKPEMFVRSLVHRMGYRFRLHRKGLPGKPDLVFPRLRKIILVHGCFWHMHNCSNGRATPKENFDFWQSKRKSNLNRDKRNLRALRRDGWRVHIVWECDLKPKQRETVQQTLSKFLTD